MSMQIEAAAGRSWLEAALWRNRLLIALVLLHLCAGIAAGVVSGQPFGSGTFPILVAVLKTTLIVFVCNFLLWRLGYGIVKERPKRPIRWFVQDLRRMLSDVEMMADGLIAFLAITVLAATFTYLKDLVPVLNPFSWDPYFAGLDRSLHGGIDPWRLLAPVFGAPLLTTALNAAYHVWFFLLYMMFFVAAFDRRVPERRMVFLVAFSLTWMIGGNLLATVFSSAGPVYYQALGHGDTFVPQMQGLRALNQVSPVWALDLQDMLMRNYLEDGPIKGISAMPSMHVATSVIMALFGFAYARWLGWVLTGFAATILIASVHLAWHYAIDGYFGVLLALACWWAAKRLVARFS